MIQIFQHWLFLYSINWTSINIYFLFLFFTFSGLVFFQFLLLILNGLHLCVVYLSQLIPVCPVVVQTIKHGLDLFVEPRELLINGKKIHNGYKYMREEERLASQIHLSDQKPTGNDWHMFTVTDVCVFFSKYHPDKRLADIPPGASWVQHVHLYTSCYPTWDGWSYNNTSDKL